MQNAVYQQVRRRGYAAPVDVLMDVGVLDNRKYIDWRNGRVPYLEAVCSCSLRQLSFIMKQIRICSAKSDYSPSICCYRQWGAKHRKGVKKPVRQLRFSKSGNPEIERAYATHYVDGARINELREEKTTEAVEN